MKCTGPKHKDVLFSERCNKPAMWRTHLGPRCQACTDDLEASIQRGQPTLIAMMLDRNGGTTPRKLGKWPIQ